MMIYKRDNKRFSITIKTIHKVRNSSFSYTVNISTIYSIDIFNRIRLAQ